MTFKPRGSVGVWFAAAAYSREPKGVRVVASADCTDRPGEGERVVVEGGSKLDSIFFLRGSHLNCITMV